MNKTHVASAVGAIVALWFMAAVSSRADTIEGKTGVVIDGKIVDRNDESVTIEVMVNGRAVKRMYRLGLIRAITIDGKREVLDGSESSPQPGAGRAAPPPARADGQRTRREVEQMIETVGSTPPDWFDATPLNYPASLDLSWPEPAPGGWNNQKNMGQYIWDIINPNANKWPEGIRLMHHLLVMHKDDAEKRTRIMKSIGAMYFRFFQDYPRAAFWWRKAGVDDGEDVAGLAECYWRMGNRQMAVDLLNKHNRVTIGILKLWADMGETDKALKLAELFQNGNGAASAYMTAGDACRLVGRYKQALAYYQKVLTVPDTDRNKRDKDRARASITAIKLFDTLDVSRIADGKYRADSLGYEGPIEVEVTVAGGRIEDVKIVRHTEKQFYSALRDTPAQIITKQSVKGVDATSRATITSEAIINASAKALSQGVK